VFARYPDVNPNDPVTTQFADSDFETETELPPLESVISKEVFRKLKPKEKKWYDVVNGKHHVTITAVDVLITCKDCSSPAVSIKLK